jgi:hypothetical protein
MTDEATPMSGKFDWRWGVVDGERLMRDRAERLLEGDDGADKRLRDDEDMDRHDMDRDGSRGWRDMLRRSLSRSARPRVHDNDRHRQDQQRQRECDRSSQGGRRMGAGTSPARGSACKTKQVQ